MKKVDLIGQRFGRLLVLAENGTVRKKSGRTYRTWLCKCDCGNTKIATTNNLKAHNTSSCGCYKKEYVSSRAFRHGKCRTRLYKIFQMMKDRCYNPKAWAYQFYGAKGVKIHQKWLDDFNSFYGWAIANGYTNKLSVERKDVNGNYEPNNCIWITQSEQVKNRTMTHFVTYQGQKMTLTDLERLTGICRQTIRKYEVKYNYDYDLLVSDMLQNSHHIRHTKTKED